MMEAATIAERIDQCERILKENSRSQVFAALADALRLNGDLEKAFRVCRQGLRIHPDYGAGHLVMAKISLGRKMYDWAEQELTKAVEFDGETRATEQLRVEILIGKGSYSEADAAIRKLRVAGANPLLVTDLHQRLERQKKESKRRNIDQSTGAPRGKGSEAKTAAPVAKPKTPLTLGQALDQLAALPFVDSIVCAHTDGTPVDHRGDSPQDINETAAFGVEMCRIAETENAIANFGEAQQIAVENGERTIVIMKFSRYNLVIYCQKGINLGAMRMRLEDIRDNLQDG